MTTETDELKELRALLFPKDDESNVAALPAFNALFQNTEETS